MMNCRDDHVGRRVADENALLREALNVAMAKLMLCGEDETLRRLSVLVERANALATER